MDICVLRGVWDLPDVVVDELRLHGQDSHYTRYLLVGVCVMYRKLGVVLLGAEAFVAVCRQDLLCKAAVWDSQAHQGIYIQTHMYNLCYTAKCQDVLAIFIVAK